MIELLAVSVLWVRLDARFWAVFGALDGCQTHDKRMAFMRHSLRAHAVLMFTHVNTCFWCSGSQTDGTHVGLMLPSLMPWMSSHPFCQAARRLKTPKQSLCTLLGAILFFEGLGFLGSILSILGLESKRKPVDSKPCKKYATNPVPPTPQIPP